MSPLQGSKPLYKPRLGHLESHSFCKQGDRKPSAAQSKESNLNCFYFALFPWGTMWKAVVLAVCLLVAGVQPMDDPAYGVKLCGREFIRAVIFTCGGSRWRRSLRSAGERLKAPWLHHYWPCDVSYLQLLLVFIYDLYIHDEVSVFTFFCSFVIVCKCA